MQAFAAGEIDVLVATTVVEVGVDVPNATRHGASSTPTGSASPSCTSCAAASAAAARPAVPAGHRVEPGTPARERLEAVAATLDGFELARVDLEQRREGDVLGKAQSGGAVVAAAAARAPRRGAHRGRPARGRRARRAGPGRGGTRRR